jgi:hypothetical protein
MSRSKARLLVTDEWVGYRGLDAEYAHAVIKHTKGEYARDDAHTNTIEGFWSLAEAADLRHSSLGQPEAS